MSIAIRSAVGRSALVACLLLAVAAVSAAEPEPPAACDAAIPAELVDDGFLGKIDLAAIRGSLLALDAARLTDQALLLAEAEQQVGRAHKSLAAGDLMQAAARVARETGDRETLARLSAIAHDRGDTALASLSAQPRSTSRFLGRVDPDLGVPLSELSAESVVLFRAYRNQILLAKALNDQGTLNQLARGIEQLTELHTAQRAFLMNLIEQVRRTLEGATPTVGVARLAASAIAE